MKDEPRYFHVRLSDFYNMDYPTPIGTALRNFAYSQGATFAFEKRSDGWYLGYCMTSITDNFNRRLGRMIAKGRLKCKRKGRSFYYGHEEPTFEDVLTLFDLLRYERLFSQSEYLEGFECVETKPIH